MNRDVEYSEDIAMCQSYLGDIQEFLIRASSRDACTITDTDREKMREARAKIAHAATLLYPNDFYLTPDATDPLK